MSIEATSKRVQTRSPDGRVLNTFSTDRYAAADPRAQPRDLTSGAITGKLPDGDTRRAVGVPMLLTPLPASKLFDIADRVPSNLVDRPEFPHLRERLIGDQGGSVIGLVGKASSSSRAQASKSTVGIAGTAGLGKSTACGWLAHDLRVQTAFHDGIYWLTFGQELTDVMGRMRMLAVCVR